MTSRTRSLLWWLPALIVALLAGIMSDTFLENPDSTIPHEAAFVLRQQLIAIGLGYAAIVLVVRLCLHFARPSAGRARE